MLKRPGKQRDDTEKPPAGKAVKRREPPNDTKTCSQWEIERFLVAT